MFFAYSTHRTVQLLKARTLKKTAQLSHPDSITHLLWDLGHVIELPRPQFLHL